MALNSALYGEIISDIANTDISNYEVIEDSENADDIKISITDHDFNNLENLLLILVLVAGYAAHATLNKIKSQSCKKILITDKDLAIDAKYDFMKGIDRGSLKYPRLNVINIIVYVLIEKLILEPN